MFPFKFKDLSISIKENFFYYLMLAFCAFLPFQFALNPAEGFDVSVVRILIPTLFLILIIFKLKHKQSVFHGDKLLHLLLIFIFLAIFSMFFSQNLFWSLRKLFFLLTIFPIYFIFASVFNSLERKRTAFLFLVFGATLLSWLAIIQFMSQFIFGIDTVYSFLATKISTFFLGNSFSGAVLAYPSWLVSAGNSTYMRAFAIFPDPHMFAYYLEMLIPWSIALWSLGKKHRNWLIFFSCSLVIANILTFTRGSYIALIAGSIAILPLVSKKTLIKIVLGAVFLTSTFFIAPHNSPVVGRFTSSFNPQEGSNQARMANWQQAISIISSHPFGVGIGSYSLAVKPTASYREPIYAHSLYLDLTAELGVQTLIIFIAILFVSFRSFWLMSKSEPFFIAGVASLTIFSVHSIVENPMYSIHILTLFLIVIALSAKSYVSEKNIKSE